MADDNLIPYEDIFELRKEVEGMKNKKDVSTKELYDSIQKLSQTIGDMLEVFGAAAEQIKLEEKGNEAELKKLEIITFKLDKLIDQNKTIAEGMVALVDLVNKKVVASESEKETEERDEPLFKSEPEPISFTKPQMPEWQPQLRSQPALVSQKPQFEAAPSLEPMLEPPQASLDLELGMPPMRPAPDLDFMEEPPLSTEQEQKKKGLFGIFKK